ncbi:MAG TPA: hypothetical protein VGF45_09255 [Polyangia bacterium]
MIARGIVISIALFTATACSRKPPAVVKASAPPVQTWGTLREVMHEGNVGPKVVLRNVMVPHLYGVGALVGLSGEVAIVDGKAFVARADGNSAVVAPAPEATAATLLVAAAVSGWINFPLQQPVGSSRELDAVVESAARKAGLDLEQPFPFLVIGKVDARWHVLRGQPGHAGGGHAAHLRNAITGRLSDTAATVIGFFSRHHEGVFTHMGERSHLHVISDDASTMGHVDDIAMPAGATLKLPRKSSNRRVSPVRIMDFTVARLEAWRGR